MTLERRTCESLTASIETRADGARTLVGYAATFYSISNPDTEYALWDNMVERIMPTAFNRALAESQDVLALFDHDPAQLLGRVASGTLKLSVDGVGLRYEVALPDTSLGRDLAVWIARGDVRGASFGFRATSTKLIEQPDGRTIREVHDCDLRDVGPVVRPAYGATTADIRSEIEQTIAAQQARRNREREAVAVRRRRIQVTLGQ